MLSVMTLVTQIPTEKITTLVTQTLTMWARMMLMMTMMPMQTLNTIMLMVKLTQTTVNIIPLMVTPMQTVFVLKIPEANYEGTDNVEVADSNIADAYSNSADDADADNAGASPNAKDDFINDIDDNDYGTYKNNPDIDYPGETDAQHDPL